MSTVTISKYRPSAQQIVQAALAIADRPSPQLIVESRPGTGDTVLGGAPYEGRRQRDYDRALVYLEDMTRKLPLKNQVFLGGACDPTTWRQDIAIPAFDAAGVAYFNPQVKDWYPELVAVEAEAKNTSFVLLFVLDSQTRGLATLIEAVDFIERTQQNVVLVMADLAADCVIDGQPLTKEEVDDINAARALLREAAIEEGIPIFADVEDAVEECIILCKSTTDVCITGSFVIASPRGL